MLADDLNNELLAIMDSFNDQPITDELEDKARAEVESWISERLVHGCGFRRHTIRFVVWANRNERSMRVLMDIDPLRREWNR